MIYKNKDMWGFEISEEISLQEAEEMICSLILKDWSVQVIDGVGITLSPIFYVQSMDGEFRPVTSLIGDVQELKCYDRITDPMFLVDQDYWISRAKQLQELI